MLLVPILAMMAAQAGAAPAAPNPGGELREIVQDCSAHSFEAVVSAIVDGNLKRSKMKLCGTTGQSETDWLRTLRDSADKIAANDGIAKPIRDEMVKALDAEIAMRKVTSAGTSLGTAATSDFSLKPRSAAPVVSNSGAMAGYNILPPLPPPIAVSAELIRESLIVPAAEIPDLTFECVEQGQIGGDGCETLSRDTLFAVRAREAIKPGASLRFMRRDEDRGSVELGPMRKGQTARFALPSQVCRGVANSEVEIQVMIPPAKPGMAARVARREGPLTLHC